MTLLRKTMTVFAATAALTAGAANAEVPNPLNFGIISTESAQNLKSTWTPFLEDMEKKLGVEVKAFFAPDYAGIIEGMRFDKVDVAWHGNKSAMEAVDRAGGEVFVQTVDVGGNPGYWSLLVTHKDSPLNTLQDVLKCDKTLVFGNGDPNSTSGFLVPSYYVFAQNGVTPQDCFKTIRSANHETNAMAAANKQVDVATNNTESVARIQANNPSAYKNIKVIWKSPLIPADPIVWRRNLSDEAKGTLKAFFMSYGRIGPDAAREREILKKLSWGPFNDSTNAQLYPIRQLELFRNRAKLESDDRMDAAEKKQKIAEIDRQLETLKVLAAGYAGS